jgi:hypothetical protein
MRCEFGEVQEVFVGLEVFFFHVEAVAGWISSGLMAWFLHWCKAHIWLPLQQ